MTYKQTISYLYDLLPVFHRIGAKAFKADLNNTEKFCAYLNNPEHKFKSIHIAGTNGKGSTSHFLAAILQSAGYKTGLYTSPHLKDYSERFRINGKPIAKQKIISFVKKHQNFIEEMKPSFFELSVALAFDFFAKEAVDIAVIEVGLGGRLDSTNVIKPLLSVITNIGLDHTDILGDTLAKISTEKAGIIKQQTPVVVSQRHIETDAVFTEIAQKQQADIYFAQDKYQCKNVQSNLNGLELDILGKKYTSQLLGTYQLKNIAGVFQAVEILRNQGWEISDDAVQQGLSQVCTLTGLQGRWQILNQEPLIIADTAHNEHGLRETIQQVLQQNKKQIHFVLGFVRDKSLDKILPLFPTNFGKKGFDKNAPIKYYFCEADSPRALPAEELQIMASYHGLGGITEPNIKKALRLAKKNARKNDLIYIGGSTFVVAEIV